MSPLDRSRPSPHAARALRCALAAALLVGVAGAGAGPASSAHDGWRRVWSDEFNGRAGSAPDPRRWFFDLGRSWPGGPPGWGNNELQTYTDDPANVALDGKGALRITATRDERGQWRSARLQSVRSNFRPPPGGRLLIAARLRLPMGGAGYWPAFWAMGEPIRRGNATWPAGGEIDVMENINSDPRVSGALHCGPGGACADRTGLFGWADVTKPGAWHTYAVIWEPQRLRWLVDGREFHVIERSRLGKRTWEATVGHSYFLLLNLAMGGNFPGPPNSRTVPGESMLVDWVRVSSR